MTANRAHCRENEALRKEQQYKKQRRRLIRSKVNRAWKKARRNARRVRLEA